MVMSRQLLVAVALVACLLSAVRAEDGVCTAGDASGCSLVDTLTSGAPVVIFSKSYCPYCKRAKRALLAKGISAIVLELNLRPDGGALQAELLAKTGQRTVPSVWLNGEFVGGSDDTLHAIASGEFDDVQPEATREYADSTSLQPCSQDATVPCLFT